ncbi:zinc finger and BTB domain-containing protein 22b isoform X2 [Stigmatopora argus]
MQSSSGEVDSSSGDSVVQVRFPASQASVLESLNQQREDGRLCDLAIHVQGHVFKAHRCVLAASSPYFHDQVLLKNMSSVSIPAVMDPLAFESVLRCAYTGHLSMLRQDIVNYLTVGSVLQMWHIVDKCTELLKEGRAAAGGPARAAQRAPREPPPAPRPPSRPPAGESQSPSSTNYFSPGAAAPSMAADTLGYCAPSGEESFALEEGEEEEGDQEEEEEDEEEYQPKRKGGRRKKSSSASEEDVSDGFGVSSYQDGRDASVSRRPAYARPGERWVVVKAERAEGGGEEEEEEEEDEDDEDEEVSGRARDCGDFAISHVRTLSVEGGGGRGDSDTRMDYCHSSQDFLKMEGSLLDATVLAPHAHVQDGAAGPSSGQAAAARGASGLLPANRAQLLPLDMQGNQILIYGQSAAPPMDAAPPPAPSGTGVCGGPFKSMAHGPAAPGNEGAGGGGGPSAKVFMCHCGKTFTHKSMRDRHINMHLDLRPFHCPVCAKKFKMKHHLTEHMKTHTGLKPYHCAGCGRKFMWRDSFVRHRAHCQRGGDADVLPGGAPRGGGGGGGGGLPSRLHHAVAGMFGGLPLDCGDLAADG